MIIYVKHSVLSISISLLVFKVIALSNPDLFSSRSSLVLYSYRVTDIFRPHIKDSWTK